MVTKQIILILLVLPFAASALTVKTEMKSYQLIEKSGLHLSKSCKDCDAAKAVHGLTAETAKKFLETQQDKRVSPGVRLCQGMGALTYVGMDTKQQEWSVCEFKDGSAVLSDDLAGIIRKFGI
jgi:hypothetical protein